MLVSERKSTGRILFGINKQHQTDLDAEKMKLLRHWGKHPWHFISAKDPITGNPVINTKDEIEGKVRPYPAEKEYLKELVNDLRQDDIRYRVEETGKKIKIANVFLIHKSRQMIVTTTCMLVCLWEILFREAQRVILSKVTEDDAKEILRDKLRSPWANMPHWIKKALPLTQKPEGRATAEKTGSYVLAAAENAAERECRGGTASRLVIDEAAFQDRTKDIFDAGVPMARRITIITTPLPGSPGGKFVRSCIFDEDVS